MNGTMDTDEDISDVGFIFTTNSWASSDTELTEISHDDPTIGSEQDGTIIVTVELMVVQAGLSWPSDEYLPLPLPGTSW